MNNLEAIRTQRAETEVDFQTAFKDLLEGFDEAFTTMITNPCMSTEAQTAVLALHREVCALYAAELSLITSGKLSNQEDPVIEMMSLRYPPNQEPRTNNQKPQPSFPLHPSSLDHDDSPTQPVPPLPRQDAPRLSLLPRLLARVTRAFENRPLHDSSPSTP